MSSYGLDAFSLNSCNSYEIYECTLIEVININIKGLGTNTK